MSKPLKSLLVTFGALLLCVGSYAQQYPVFTQYYFNELVINPAYAGAHVQFSATSMYRNQWVNYAGAPKTFSVSAHTSLLKNKIGVGLLVNHDEIGSYRNNHIYFSYAYKIKFPTATLSMGLSAGFNLLGADFSKLDLQNPSDASFAPLINVFKPNFGAGLYYNKKNYFIGFSVPFLINNQVISSAVTISEARYYYLRAGAILPLDQSKNVKLNPSILLRTQEGQPITYDINAAFIFYDVLSAGVSYRNVDAFITFVDLKLSEKFHFAYSYDWTQSQINNFSNGSHEFMINYRAKITSVHKNLECPRYYDYR